MPTIEFNVVIAYVFGLILLYLIGWVLLVPIKITLRLIYNGLLGGIALIVINFIGGFFSIHIGVNPITALVAGVLGIPGIILIFILKYFFKI